MVRYKLKPILLVCLVILSLMAPAYASGYYASNEAGGGKPPASIDSITVSTEGVTLPEKQDTTPLTPDGNLTLIDDILQDSGCFVSEGETVANKQFITVQSKNGNYFYLVIDRSGDKENVYFLNLVDEADLLALMESEEAPEPACICEDRCEIGAIRTDCEVCRSNLKDCTGKEKVIEQKPEPKPDPEPDPDKEEKDSGSGAVVALVLLLVAGGGAAVSPADTFSITTPAATSFGSSPKRPRARPGARSAWRSRNSFWSSTPTPDSTSSPNSFPSGAAPSTAKRLSLC